MRKKNDDNDTVDEKIFEVKSMPISRECLGLAGEFAVASELCRRNIYAQLTFGNKKRTDILIMSENENFMRIEVKAKQKAKWPNCKGIYGNNVFLVFVDFAKKKGEERPDFYIMNSEDWRHFVENEIEKIKQKKPGENIEMNSENVPVWRNQINKYKKPYMGIGVNPKSIQEHREDWDKIKAE
jgi:hypothetical protein